MLIKYFSVKKKNNNKNKSKEFYYDGLRQKSMHL